ncbi:MAG TPA: pyridoxal phosphate-dependent aminotransferase [Rhodothermales bacterium]|nr:pyridoxal phosphate-dependent aminotransferase [Rhodothermales bacterium]
MKSLARRTDALSQSDIRAITKLVNAVNGINLGQGICDLPTPEPIKQGAQQAIADNHSIYTNYAGIKRLRALILEKAQSYNRIPATSDEEVMVSVGSTGAFVAAIFALLEADDEVILFEPFYGYHRNLLDLIGVDIKYLPTTMPDWSIDFDLLEQTITPKTKALVVTTPTNPTGKVWTRDELERLLALMQKHDLYAITDEIYEYMLYDGHEHVSLASLPGAYERTVTLSGFSKTYNMTGWRLGYAVAAPPLIDKMGLLNDLFYICAPAPLQHGVAEAFEMSDVYFEEMQEAYTAKRQLLCETLEQIGFDVPWPDGSYYVFANFERFSHTYDGFDDAQEACQSLIEKAGVATVPGHSFFEIPERGRYFLRFCYAKEMPILQEACNNLLNAFS